MKSLLIIFLLSIGSTAYLIGQKDSLHIQTEIGIRGRWQTGNLDQFALNPNAKILIKNNQINLEFSVDYQYLNVNNFTVKSDLWTSGMFQYKPKKQVYPMALIRYGYSKSYKIDHSLLFGLGVGINIHNKSPTKLLQFNAFVGYMNIAFENKYVHSAAIGGIQTKLVYPIIKRMNISWELQSYHSGKDSKFWGMDNMIMIQYKLLNNLFINLKYDIIYNNKPIANISKTNTIMLFGINYQYNN